MVRILITGGSGLIGEKLIRLLLEKGYEVSVLSRNPDNIRNPAIRVFHWDIEKNEIEQEALTDCDYIVHLAGANMGEQRWSNKRKQQILDSRIKTAGCLRENLEKQNHKIKTFISASAIGYYGAITSHKIFDENSSYEKDFLGTTCHQWEQSADSFTDLGIRVVKIRTGVVLSPGGGVLSKLNFPVRMGLGAAIGTGKQYLPWIHLDDLCKIYQRAIENSNMKGAYNAVAPEHITNQELISRISKTLKRPFWLPNIPSFFFKMLFGELSGMLLNGSRVSSDKLVAVGYKFNFPTIDKALRDIYN